MNDNKLSLKELWKSQPASLPNSKEMQTKLQSYKKNNLLKMAFAYFTQLLPLVVFTLMLIFIDFEHFSTKAGLFLMLIAIFLFMLKYGDFYSNFQKLENTQSNKVYLQNLLELKKKQHGFQTKFLSGYYILLNIGLCLTLFEPFSNMPFYSAVLVFLATALWVAFNWFYLRKKTIRKEETKINELIEHYSTLNKQLEE